MSRFSRLAVACALVPLAQPQRRVPSSDALVLYSAGLDGLLVDENDTGLARVLDLLDERVLDLGRELGGSRFPTEGARLVCELLNQPFCLRFGPADDPASGPFHLQLTVTFGDSAEGQALTRRLVGGLRSAGMSLEGGGADGWSFPTPLGAATLISEEDGGSTQVRLALGGLRPELFTFADAGLPQGIAPAAYARFDGRVLDPLLAPFAEFLGHEAATALNALEMLGLLGSDATARTWALGYTPERAFVVSKEYGHTKRARGTGRLVEESLSPADFARVPIDAGLVGLRQVRPTAWLDLLDAIEPGTSKQVRAEFRAELDVDLRADLLEPLGPTVGAYASRSTGGSGLMSLVGFMELNDAHTFQLALTKLVARARQSLRAPAQGHFDLREWSHGDTTCTSLVFPGLPVPIDVSFAVADETVWIALSRGALASALDQRSAESCVLDHPRLASMPESYLTELQGFGFMDTATYLERGYGGASFVAAGLENLVRSPEDEGREPGPMLPGVLTLLEGAQPAISFARRQGDDLVSVSILDRSWTTNGTAAVGTPMSHSYAMVAGSAIVAAVAIPNLLSARVSANESAAIATLRSVCSAQYQFQAVAVVDCDRDGDGEFAWFGELAGARPVRVPAPTGSAWGQRGQDELDPPYLSPTFAELQDDGTGEGVVLRSGYYFKLFLPGRAVGGRAPGYGEPVRSEADAPSADAENSELAFCCYAWPAEPGKTGARTFFVNQDGDVLQLTTTGAYGGTFDTGGRQPTFDAAYAESDMLAPLAVHRGEAGQDGGNWVLLGR